MCAQSPRYFGRVFRVSAMFHMTDHESEGETENITSSSTKAIYDKCREKKICALLVHVKTLGFVSSIFLNISLLVSPMFRYWKYLKISKRAYAFGSEVSLFSRKPSYKESRVFTWSTATRFITWTCEKYMSNAQSCEEHCYFRQQSQLSPVILLAKHCHTTPLNDTWHCTLLGKTGLILFGVDNKEQHLYKLFDP